MFRSYDHLHAEIYTSEINVTHMNVTGQRFFEHTRKLGVPIPPYKFIYTHTCIKSKYNYLNLGVCILLRALDQAQGFPYDATLFQ
jgi:hypothetical protein